MTAPKEAIVEIENLQSDLVLFLAAAIWGFAFVAQRMGMAHVGPFTFNGVRFALGTLSLLPLFFLRRKEDAQEGGEPKGSAAVGGTVAGMALFIGASLQQVGLVYTTAGKAGFITGLYVVIVPILGFFLGQRIRPWSWVGAVTAAVGLYFLSITEDLHIAFGDLLEIAGAFFWAIHVIIIGRLSPRVSSINLCLFQFMTCSALSLATGFLIERMEMEALIKAAIPILYGGLFSVGIAYTLQVVGQKKAPPTHAAIILSLEAVFAALGGWLILGETIPLRGLVGCGFMFSAMILSQVHAFERKAKRECPAGAQ